MGFEIYYTSRLSQNSSEFVQAVENNTERPLFTYLPWNSSGFDGEDTRLTRQLVATDDALKPNLATDNHTNVFLGYYKENSDGRSLILSMYNAQNSTWNTTLFGGTDVVLIDKDLPSMPNLAIDDNRIVYISYQIKAGDGKSSQVYLYISDPNGEATKDGTSDVTDYKLSLAPVPPIKRITVTVQGSQQSWDTASTLNNTQSLDYSTSLGGVPAATIGNGTGGGKNTSVTVSTVTTTTVVTTTT